MARVLVIDDEPNIIFILKTALNNVGHEVLTANDGISGLAQLEQGINPDIVLADLNMPRLGGRALVEAMFINPQLNKIPVVIITSCYPGSKDFPPTNHYQALISKPFDLLEIIKIVQRFTDPLYQNNPDLSVSTKLNTNDPHASFLS